MKRFRFRLERLERVRELKERETRGKLGEMIRLKRQMERERDETKQSLGALEANRPELDGPVEAVTLKQLGVQRDLLRRRIDAMNVALAEVETLTEKAAREHRQAAREHQALEKLHARRFDRWLQDYQLEERKFLDESFLQRRGRKTAHKETGR